MNLVIDYGNSSAKAGVFDDHRIVEKFVFASAEELRAFLGESRAENVIVSSVNMDAGDVLSWASHAHRKFILHHTLPLPVGNKYATPATLGVDRLAGICGARQMFPDANCLVIDAGTCITYDFLEAEGNFLGGGISPGLMMRFQALHTFTKRLPLVSLAQEINLIGATTEECIRSGVVNGVIQELDGIIDRYREKFADLRVILCGGDAQFFENKLKAAIFAVPELVLSGLNSILIYNVSR